MLTTRPFFSRNEVLVIQNRLGSDAQESEEERIRRAGLPRTTYMEAKQRLYARRVLQDVYIPTSGAAAISKVRFTLLRVFSDKRDSVTRELLARPRTVLVWAGAHSVFGVSMESDAPKREPGNGVPVSDFGTSSVELSCTPDPTAIPVYFDFEGGWSNLAGLDYARRWPRPFPPPAESKGRGWFQSRLPSPDLMRSLLERPFRDEGGSPPSHLLGPTTLPRSQLQLVRSGVVEWRTLLSMTETSGPRERQVVDLVFVAGRLRERSGLPGFVQDLAHRKIAYPFLAVSDGEKALLAFFGTGLKESSPASPAPPNVSGVIQSHLEDVVVVREPLSQLSVLRDHRYDQLL